MRGRTARPLFVCTSFTTLLGQMARVMERAEGSPASIHRTASGPVLPFGLTAPTTASPRQCEFSRSNS